MDEDIARLLSAVESHPATDACPDQECDVCSVRDCPYHDPLHYHHDGCPSCLTSDADEDGES
jgi:hypothetical protein